MKRRILLIPVLAALVVALVFLVKPHLLPARGMQGASFPAEKQIVKFNHKFHTSEAGIACADCHPATAKSKAASDNLHPAHDQCQQCHEDQLTNSCGYCHLDTTNIEPRVVPVRSLTFSHEQHLAMKGVECNTCHAGIEQDSTSAQTRLPAMEACTTCHNDTKAPSWCEACHTNLAQLLPPDHLQSDYRRVHGQFVRIGALNVDCATCHSENFCQECHSPVELKAFGLKDLNADPRPRTSPKDQPAQTTLQRVHDLNYRLTHGIDAKARAADCATCHDTQDFCVTCHQAGGNINQFKFKPPSHNVPGFATIGKGSGGGLHAEEARRDMESCVGCHDVPGQDPICMTCHNADGSVR